MGLVLELNIGFKIDKVRDRCGVSLRLSVKYGVVSSIKVEVEIRVWVIDGYGFRLVSRIWVFVKDTF